MINVEHPHITNGVLKTYFLNLFFPFPSLVHVILTNLPLLCPMQFPHVAMVVNYYFVICARPSPSQRTVFLFVGCTTCLIYIFISLFYVVTLYLYVYCLLSEYNAEKQHNRTKVYHTNNDQKECKSFSAAIFTQDLNCFFFC